MALYVLVGTSKGLVVLSEKGNHPAIHSVHFTGLPVSTVYVDERTNTWWVALSHRHWGEKLHYSNDQGKSWQPASVPSYKGYVYRPDKPATLKKIWCIQHAGVDKPGCLWLGTEPGGLFFSEDNGKSFHLNETLWNHPSRLDDHQWFGTGKDYPFIHSILVHPVDSNHIYVGVSCAGVFETRDGGKNWVPKNDGLKASYLPKADAEIGHDPHQMLLCKSNPNVLWQQNHCGIYRTENGGNQWHEVSGANGFPSYGFALAIDHNSPDTAWVIPAESDESRIPAGLKLQVCNTKDGGITWKDQNNGLPQEYAYDLVLRQAFIKVENKLIFGTTNGNLYWSDNLGKSWILVTGHLAGINSISVSGLS